MWVSPLIFTNTWSRCHCQLEWARIFRTRFLRISAANNGPKHFPLKRTVSWLMSMSRSCSRSSTSLSDSGNRTYIITASRMISALVLKYQNGLCLIMPRNHIATLPFTTEFPLIGPFVKG